MKILFTNWIDGKSFRIVYLSPTALTREIAVIAKFLPLEETQFDVSATTHHS